MGLRGGDTSRQEFEVGDTVEILASSAWVGEVGRIVHIENLNIYVKTYGMARPHPFGASELKLSQQKLIRPELYDEPSQ